MEDESRKSFESWGQVFLDLMVEEITRSGLRYEYEERAAILEYDGGMNRKLAEVEATIEILERIRKDAKEKEKKT